MMKLWETSKGKKGGMGIKSMKLSLQNVVGYFKCGEGGRNIGHNVRTN